MNTRNRFLAFAVLLTLSVTSTICVAGTRRETPLVEAVRNARTAVVNIHSEKTSYSTDTVFPNSKGRKVNGMGTGIVIDERGYIVTNYHVVEGVELLRVTLVDGSHYTARTLSYDRKHDLAIIKIEPTKSLSVMKLGTSSDLMPGETVFAIGNAFGYEHTITSGIISALARDLEEVNETQSYYNLIQTDASINPGNSGGPLLNLDGEVIGVNVAIRAGAQRIGFAIPIDDARKVIANLISVDQLEQTRHGLLAEDQKGSQGCKLVVQGTVTDSPASAAGFLKGDVIVKVNEIEVVDRVDFERSLLGKKVGDKVEVTYERDGETLTAEIQVGKFDPSQVVRVNAPSVVRANNNESLSDRVWRVLGIRILPLEENQTATKGTIYEGGLRVIQVKVGSPAARGGIQTGDIIVGLHRWATVSVDNVEYVLDQSDLIEKDKSLRFYILRGRQPLHGELDLSRTE
jgi:serine protease Do